MNSCVSCGAAFFSPLGPKWYTRAFPRSMQLYFSATKRRPTKFFGTYVYNTSKKLTFVFSVSVLASAASTQGILPMRTRAARACACGRGRGGVSTRACVYSTGDILFAADNLDNLKPTIPTDGNPALLYGQKHALISILANNRVSSWPPWHCVIPSNLVCSPWARVISVSLYVSSVIVSSLLSLFLFLFEPIFSPPWVN